jgi:hypothetical protein
MEEVSIDINIKYTIDLKHMTFLYSSLFSLKESELFGGSLIVHHSFRNCIECLNGRGLLLRIGFVYQRSFYDQLLL